MVCLLRGKHWWAGSVRLLWTSVCKWQVGRPAGTPPPFLRGTLPRWGEGSGYPVGGLYERVPAEKGGIFCCAARSLEPLVCPGRLRAFNLTSARCRLGLMVHCTIGIRSHHEELSARATLVLDRHFQEVS